MIEKLDLAIWGRNFTLPVQYDCYTGEHITASQIRAMEVFSEHLDWISESEDIVKHYCEHDVLADPNNAKKDNVFSYLKPECFFVKRTRKKPRVALMLKYRYDPEHGLAVVFTIDGEISVGSQDIIL